MRLLRSRKRVWLALLVVGITVFLIGSWQMGNHLIRPVPCQVGDPPHAFPSETVQIPSESGSTLIGWLARSKEHRGVVILLHLVYGNRWAMVTRAEFLHAAGYSVLLFDFQAHGESPGTHPTFGHLEGKDVIAAIRFVKEQFPGQPVGVIGWSLGGAAALLAQQPLGVDAVVLEAVYPTIQEAVVDRIRIRLGPLAPLIAPAILVQLKPRLGISPDQLRPIDRIAKLGAPILIIAGSKDQHTTLAESERMYATAREPKELWVIDGAYHVDFHQYAWSEYEKRVLDFFGKHLGSVKSLLQ